ncbi:MAG: Rieske (2Fe-2S) protein [Deltaproteobacteria bacterium]|nr:Rieske (2Fe-2S) protein [Deltaproteobacteria bacterium]
MTALEVWVCREEDLRDGAVRTARLGLDADGLPVLALLLRDESGEIVAYRNLCRHLPVPLDGGTGELLSEDGAHLICGTHGATYRLHDGYCVDGPCEGMTLQPLYVREDRGDLYVSDAPDSR